MKIRLFLLKLYNIINIIFGIYKKLNDHTAKNQAGSENICKKRSSHHEKCHNGSARSLCPKYLKDI